MQETANLFNKAIVDCHWDRSRAILFSSLDLFG
jgi:hypothetical protein